MKNKAVLLIIIFISLVCLNGCYCCGPCITCPSPTPKCSLTVIATYTSNVYGYVYLNDQNTGKYIDFEYSPNIRFENLPCNQMVKVYVVDSGPCFSHVQHIYLNPGGNTLYFTYW